MMSAVDQTDAFLKVPVPQIPPIITPYPFDQLIRLDLSDKPWTFESAQERLENYVQLFKFAMLRDELGSRRRTCAYKICVLTQKHPLYKTAHTLRAKIEEFMKKYHAILRR